MPINNVTPADFNHHDPAVMQDPYAMFDEVRSHCPLGHSKALGGFYFPTSFAGVKQAFSSFREFSSAQGTGLPDMGVPLLPVDLDPPQHTAWRRVLNRFFTPETAAADRDRIQRVADDLIDAFITRGTADAVNELTRPFLAMTMLPVIGVPIEDREMLGDKLLWMVHHRTSDPEGWYVKHLQVGAYLTGLAAGRRLAAPQGDLLQSLVDDEFDGARLTDAQIYHVLLLTLFGALDSTSSAMSGSLFHLARHPEDKRRLTSGDVGWPVAIEEFLRYTTPIQALRRTVVRATTLDGGTLQPGDMVLALNGAANRDPAKFAEPGRCIIDRDARDHMSFGNGAHICIGRHFARTMLQTCLETMLRRVPDFDVPADFTPEYTASEARALKSLPIVFSPGEAIDRA